MDGDVEAAARTRGIYHEVWAILNEQAKERTDSGEGELRQRV